MQRSGKNEVFQDEVDNRRIVYSIDEGHGYLVTLSSGERTVDTRIGMACCDNPECKCRELVLYLEPFEAEGWLEPLPEVTARVQVDTGEIVSLSEGCTPEFRRSLESLLSGNALSLLRERFRRMRLQLDPDAWKKQDWSWWEPGLLVRLRDVFPGEYDDVVEVKGRRYAIDDMYCCTPKCGCAEVIVTFVPCNRDEHASAPAALKIDLRRWKARDQDGKPLGQELLPYWQACQSLPAFKNRLRERRRRVRVVGRKLHRELGAQQSCTIPKPAGEGEETVAGKVGRNEPCPCGSGKKFKKCCGK
jgi:hypothetical protein